jgi:regulatory protein
MGSSSIGNGLPRITDLAPNAKRAGQLDVIVGGKLCATLSLESARALNLQVGTPVDEQLSAAIAREAQALGAMERALNMIAFRARSVRELRRGLLRKGESQEAVERAIERLVASGLLDDAEYARQLVRSKLVSRGFSRRRLQDELFRRGVEREVASEAIEEVMADESVDEAAMVEQLARKKLRTLAGLDAATRRRRLYAFLARRGYAPDDVRAVMEKLEGE